MKVTKVKNVLDCENIVTMDACCEEELVIGWYESLLEVFEDIDDIMVLGEVAQFKGLELNGNQVLIKVRRSKKIAKVSLDSVSFFNAPKYVDIWIKAYKKYWVS